MTPVDIPSMVEKKAKLQEAIRILRLLRKKGGKKLATDEILQGATLHYLIVAIESILDIGAHILSEDFSLSPESYEVVLSELGRKKVIPPKLAENSAGMGGFRNKVIHEYAQVNFKKVFQYLEQAPEEFERFDLAFSRYIKKK